MVFLIIEMSNMFKAIKKRTPSVRFFIVICLPASCVVIERSLTCYCEHLINKSCLADLATTKRC